MIHLCRFIKQVRDGQQMPQPRCWSNLQTHSELELENVLYPINSYLLMPAICQPIFCVKEELLPRKWILLPNMFVFPANWPDPRPPLLIESLPALHPLVTPDTEPTVGQTTNNKPKDCKCNEEGWNGQARLGPHAAWKRKDDFRKRGVAAAVLHSWKISRATRASVGNDSDCLSWWHGHLADLYRTQFLSVDMKMMPMGQRTWIAMGIAMGIGASRESRRNARKSILPFFAIFSTMSSGRASPLPSVAPSM